MTLILALVACLLFGLSAFGVEWQNVNIQSLGLAFLALAVALGALPLPTINFSRIERKS